VEWLKRGVLSSKKLCPPRRVRSRFEAEEGRVGQVFIGMDPHKLSASIEVLDDRERADRRPAGSGGRCPARRAAGRCPVTDETVFMRALGKRIRLLRLMAELSQEELGDAAGISRGFVSLIEYGTRGVDVVRLLRIAAVLGLPLHELVNLGLSVADRAEGLPS
jgi:DNA-binding XRE family transcriptional regulator